MLTLSALFIYPVKSLLGIALSESPVQPRGLQYDRRWMLIDADGRFVSQREIPAMVDLQTAIEAPSLVVFSRKNPALRVSVPLEPAVDEMPVLEVQIWDDRCPACVCAPAVNQWFSAQLGADLRLVYMPDTSQRQVDERFAAEGQYVSFADGFPFLLLGEASLEDLNRRLAHPLPMNRFRPNFVVQGSAPFAEDGWSDIRIGTVLFRAAKPCARCTIITTDQDTGARSPEPLKTLSGYRRDGQKVLFGQNLLWTGKETEPVLRLHDKIELL